MSQRMSMRAMVLGMLVLNAGCGGGADETPRATLSDSGCAYSGPQTYTHGLIENIEAANATLHFARFAIYELAPEVTIDDVRRFYERSRVAHDRGEEPGPPTYGDLYRRVIARSVTEPEARSVLPVSGPAGKLVIVCFEDSAVDTRQSSQDSPFPTAIYVPAEVEIR